MTSCFLQKGSSIYKRTDIAPLVSTLKVKNLLPSTLNGKFLLPLGAFAYILERPKGSKLFLFSVAPFQKGGKIILTELPPLKVYTN